MERPFVLIKRARSPEQLERYQEIIDTQECPFCEGNLYRWHGNPILTQGDHWLLTESSHPYAGTKKHWLVIAKYHAEHLNDMKPQAGEELWRWFSFLEYNFQIESGSLFIRFGDPEYNGGSVRHLHAHLIVPDTEADWSGEHSIRVKLGSK